MTRITPIPEELWGAINFVTFEVNRAIELTRSRDTRLAEANALLLEYGACFCADGKVSQRGEIPQCWNPETIFTPHREVKPKERIVEQLTLPFENEVK
tara:strand:+ start:780 stop:1073 length:294 start_codon:yes stop_codon:yes gene_type:complete